MRLLGTVVVSLILLPGTLWAKWKLRHLRRARRGAVSTHVLRSWD
jgi:hypothetical protein